MPLELLLGIVRAPKHCTFATNRQHRIRDVDGLIEFWGGQRVVGTG